MAEDNKVLKLPINSVPVKEVSSKVSDDKVIFEFDRRPK